MSLARTARLLAGVTQRPQASNIAQQARRMGGHAEHGNPNDYVTYAGLTLKKASFGEYAASKVVGSVMWFWVFYMVYHNWEHKLYGLPYIFEKEGLDDPELEGGSSHGHGHH